MADKNLTEVETATNLLIKGITKINTTSTKNTHQKISELDAGTWQPSGAVYKIQVQMLAPQVQLYSTQFQEIILAFNLATYSKYSTWRR